MLASHPISKIRVGLLQSSVFLAQHWATLACSPNHKLETVLVMFVLFAIIDWVSHISEWSEPTFVVCSTCITESHKWKPKTLRAIFILVTLHKNIIRVLICLLIQLCPFFLTDYCSRCNSNSRYASNEKKHPVNHITLHPISRFLQLLMRNQTKWCGTVMYFQVQPGWAFLHWNKYYLFLSTGYWKWIILSVGLVFLFLIPLSVWLFYRHR